MADSKISALSAITSLAAADQLAVAHSGASNSIRADHMPGFELDYVQLTSTTSTTSSTTIITGNAVTYDGSTRVKVEVFTPALVVGASNTEAALELFDGATDLGTLCEHYQNVLSTQVNVPGYGAVFITPTAASHTYSIKLVRVIGSGSVTVQVGSGGTLTEFPAWYRITVA